MYQLTLFYIQKPKDKFEKTIAIGTCTYYVEKIKNFCVGRNMFVVIGTETQDKEVRQVVFKLNALFNKKKQYIDNILLPSVSGIWSGANHTAKCTILK